MTDIHADDIVGMARNKAGLTEFDADSYQEGLQLLIDEINNCPAATPQGRQILYSVILAEER